MAELIRPNDGPQTAFLASTARETLYGGAVASGKSEALIYGALRWIDNPKHRALILRRTRPQLQEIIDRCRTLVPQVAPSAIWVEQRTRYEFPSGAVLQMGYAEHEDDIFAFKSAQFNYIAFDELTTFLKPQYLFMFTRNRTTDATLPCVIRSATNPGDVGHEWVYERFIRNRKPYKVYRENVDVGGGRTYETSIQFVPATVFDNPKLANRDAYIAGLMQLDPNEREAMLYGRWDAFAGKMFPMDIAEVEPGMKSHECFIIRALDYGFSDHTAVLWVVVYPRLDLLEVAAEVYVREASLDDIAHLVRETEKRLEFAPPRHSVSDPRIRMRDSTSGQSIANVLEQHGLWFTNANPDRVGGWAWLRTLLARGTLRAWRGAAPNLVRTLRVLQRDPRKVEDIKARSEDHAPDALRFAVMEYVGLSEASADPHALRPPPGRDALFEQMRERLQRGGRGSDEFEGLGVGW